MTFTLVTLETLSPVSRSRSSTSSMLKGTSSRFNKVTGALFCLSCGLHACFFPTEHRTLRFEIIIASASSIVCGRSVESSLTKTKGVLESSLSLQHHAIRIIRFLVYTLPSTMDCRSPFLLVKYHTSVLGSPITNAFISQSWLHLNMTLVTVI